MTADWPYLLFLLKNAPIWWLPLPRRLWWMPSLSRIPWVRSVLLAGLPAHPAINIPGHVWYMRHGLCLTPYRTASFGTRRRLQHLTMSFHNEQRTGALQTKVVMWNKLSN